MAHRNMLAAGLCLLITCGTWAGSTPLGTAFNYQGQLKLSGNPVNATADFQFTLFDALSGPAQVGSMVPVNNVTLSAGNFAVPLDFGALAFNGQARWLQIAVRSPAGGGAFQTLTPRQPLTAIPYALQTRGIFADATGNIGIGTTTPSVPLHIASDLNSVLLLQDTGPASTQSGYVGFWNNAGVETGWVGYGTPGSPHFSVVNTRFGGNIVLSAGFGGAVLLGPSGPRVASGDENLRIIRGTIGANGSILAGAGFTVTHPLLGVYTILFNTPFAAPPTVTATFVLGNHSRTATIFLNGPPGPDFVSIAIDFNDSDHEDFNLTDREFHFIAVGPR